MKDGAIAEVGTFEGLMSSSGALTEFLEEVLIEGARNRKRLESIGDQEVEIVLGELERFNPAKRQRIQSQLSQITVSSDESFKTAQSPASDDKVETSTAYDRGTRAITPVTVPNDADVCSEKEALLKTSKPPSLSNRISKSALIQKEAIAEGKVKWEVYVTYIRAIGFAVTFIFFSIYVLASVLGVASNLWLADWSDHAKIRNSSLTEDDTNLRLVIYASLGLGQAIFVSFGAVVMALGMVHASRYLHELILKNILKSPMIFFDVTPLGRILNRFGKV
ncbi:hypothetical protein AB6A40_011329 [Gnathostoma spinigerum]|uniref:ABC transmembrane type-1 domain-containing protein n=1 Tax=Gnathostoma spinigerum TaxID=75299 RepID=A0ABD6EXE1_9BILA